MTEEERRKEKSVCPKCGKENPEDAVFCNSCGAKLLIAGKGGFEGLISLHVVAVLYTFLSVAFNELVRVAPLFLSLYLATGVLGLIVVYALAAGKAKGWTKFVSVAMIATGLAGSFLLFLIGLTLRGIIGPDWVIFIVTGALLWKDRRSL